MATLDLLATMNAIAAAALAAESVKEAFGWPVDSAQPGAAIVGYPREPIKLGVTFGRASDEATFPVWIIAGAANLKSAREFLGDLISGAGQVVSAIEDGTALAALVSSVSVATCQVDRYRLAGVVNLAARFDVEVYT